MSWSQRYPQVSAADLQYRLSRMIAFGSVAQVDYDKARVKVLIGEWTTGWLPWITARAGNDVNWCAPETGEQVMVLSPSGDMAQGVVLGSIYQGDQQQLVEDIDISLRQSIHRTRYLDGTVIEYDRENHVLKADVKGDVELIVENNLNATVSGDVRVSVQGNLSADVTQGASIVADTISLEARKDMTLKAGGTMKLNASHISAQE